MIETMADAFTELRPLLFSIAYRMLGSVSDAEDVVQDAYLRYHRALEDGTEIESPKAYLSAVTTRLAIDVLRSARLRRETYVGQWLPEPLLTDPQAPDPAQASATADSLSMAFLLVLERLSPVERAVFLLHDVFGYEFAEIATIVDKSPDNCRQIAVRARRHVSENRPRFEASRARREELADRFVAAFVEGDVDGLVDLLAADVVVTGDSGGVPPSWSRPIVGRDKVARLLLGLAEQLQRLDHVTMERLEVNGQPGAVVRDADGALVNVFSFDVVDASVRAVRSVISRDKLRHLGPLADLSRLRGAGDPKPGQRALDASEAEDRARRQPDATLFAIPRSEFAHGPGDGGPLFGRRGGQGGGQRRRQRTHDVEMALRLQQGAGLDGLDGHLGKAGAADHGLEVVVVGERERARPARPAARPGPGRASWRPCRPSSSTGCPAAVPQAARPSRPPGRSTRWISASATSGSGTSIRPIRNTTTSTLSSGNAMPAASRRAHLAPWAAAPGACAAASTMPGGDVAGQHRAVRPDGCRPAARPARPVPAPSSSTRCPASGRTPSIRRAVRTGFIASTSWRRRSQFGGDRGPRSP